MAYLELVLSAVCSAIGIVAQTVAARRAEARPGLDPGLLARLASDRLYLVGFVAQALGFVFAFFARATLPLFLVQAGSAAAVGLAAMIGAVVLKWRVGAVEIVAIVVLAVGLFLLVPAAHPAPSSAMPVGLGYGLFGMTIVVIGLAVVAVRFRGSGSAVMLGVLAGVAWSILAIAARPLADGPILHLFVEPLAYLMVVAALVGQTLMAAALQRGSTPSVMAAMDSTTTVFSAVIGLVLLGDAVVNHRGPWVVIGLTLVVASIVVLAATGKAVPGRTDEAVPRALGEEAAAG